MPEPETLRVHIPLELRRRGGRPRILPPKHVEAAMGRGQDPHLLRAIGRAWGWRQRLERGDVATLADHVIVIEDGRIAAAGAPADLLAAPATRFLAGFAGLVTVRGRARLLDDDTIAVTAPTGTTIVGVRGGGVDAAAPVARPIAEGAEAVALFSPSAVTLGPVDGERPETSARNVIDCAVRAIRHQGAAVRVELGVAGGTGTTGGADRAGEGPVGEAVEANGPDDRDTVIIAEISAHSLATLGLAEGSPVRATVKAMQVQVLPITG